MIRSGTWVSNTLLYFGPNSIYFSYLNIISIDKVFYGCIRDLWFNLHLHQILINVLIWWYKIIIRSGLYRLKLSKKILE